MDKMFGMLTNHIKNHNQIIIMTHKRPDLDGIGSAVCLYKIIELLKKEASITISNDKLDVSIKKTLKKLSDNDIIIKFNEKPKEKALLIILDTQKEELLENNLLLKEIKDIIIIDHHIPVESKISNTIMTYINPNKSSVAEIIVEYIKYLKIEINFYLLTILLAAIETDTNGFNLKTTYNTFENASYLLKKGADNIMKQEILKRAKNSIVKRQKYLKESFMIKENIAMCTVDDQIHDAVELSLIADDLLRFDKVEAAFVIGKISSFIVGVSARSIGTINVEKIIKKIGGGGHSTDAAAQIENKKIKEVKHDIIKIIT